MKGKIEEQWLIGPTKNNLFFYTWIENLYIENLSACVVFLLTYNPGHNILELYKALVQIRVTTSKTKLDT